MSLRNTLSLTLVLTVLIASLGTGAAVSPNQVIGEPTVDPYVPNNQLTPGEETTLGIYLSNDGELTRDGRLEYVRRVTTARGTVLEVDDTGPIDVETEAIPVGDVPTGTTGPVEVGVTVPEGTPPGTYEIPIDVRYKYTRIVTYTGDGDPEFSESTFRGDATITVEVVDRPRFEIVDTESTTQIGDRGQVTMTVENVGTEPARDGRVTVGSSSDELTFGTESKTADSFVGAWDPGERKQVTYTLAATEDAIQREYTLTANVRYTDLDGVQRSSDELVGGVTPRDEQTFSLDAVESSLRVDAEGTVTGTVTNEGPSTVYEPVLRVSGGSQNLAFTETEYALPTLEPGESREFAFEADVSDAATAGSQQFSFTVAYQNEGGDDRTSSTLRRAVDIGPQRDQFAVEPVSATLERGGSETVTLELTNRGDEPVTDVSVKTYFNDPLGSSDDEAFAPSLDPGESTTVEFAADAGGDALTKQYPVSVDVQYTMPDGDTKLSKTHTVAVDVTEPSDEGGLPIPIPAVVGAVALVGVGVVVWRRREA